MAMQCLPWMRDQVQRGVAQLWECTDGKHKLHVVTRLDSIPTEWTICYARGSGLSIFGPYFVAMGLKKHWPVRMHTQSIAVARLCRRMGFRLDEFVLRVNPWA
jgi:hypothetical protein